MFQFFGGTPVKIVCDNLKTGVTAHPRRDEVALNEAYLSLGEYYSVAIMPTGVKKPKQKASAEGSVGKIATAVIAKLRNDSFTSLAALLPKHLSNGMRTEENHLPFPLRKNMSVDALRDKARETRPKTFEVIRRMFDETKAEEQPVQTVKAILSIADIYSPDILEKACDNALRQYHMPYYKTIYSHAKNVNSEKEVTKFKENNKKSGIVRGADYYRKGEKENEYRN